MSRLITIYILFVLSFGSSVCADEIRAMWVVRFALNSASEAEHIINTAKSLKITDLYVQVRALGQNYGYLNNPAQGEPLSNLIEKAHREKIRVHAWLNAMYIWAGDQPPADPKHVYNYSQIALLRSEDEEGIPAYSEFKAMGIEGYFVDPLSKENQLDLKVIISKMINKYRVDGIHLDYFRIPSIDYSFSPLGRTAYFLENWYDPIHIFREDVPNPALGSIQIKTESLKTYQNFLQDNFTYLLKDIGSYITQIDTTVELSIAVKPNLLEAKRSYAQDWSRWLKEGLCDKIVMMNYSTDMRLFSDNLNLVRALDFNDRIIVGVSAYNQDHLAVKQRIEKIRSLKFSGYSLFSYNYLNENSVYLSSLILISEYIN